MSAQRILILGGAGMVGLQVAREAARELQPSEIIISALTTREVDEAVELLRGEAKQKSWKFTITGAAGDIFLGEGLQGKPRPELVKNRELFDELFDDIFSPGLLGYEQSFLRKLLLDHRPDVVVDCINTATAISYQDVYTTSRKVKVLLDRLADDGSLPGGEMETFVESVRELLIAQGVPQIVRHIVFLQRALQETSASVYVKVGTTGTGGMGINIPYTHSEDRPSATLLSKSAIGFAHTGLLFLLARTPGLAGPDGDERTRPTMIKEVKPGAMIGFKRLGMQHVKLNAPQGGREPGYLLTPKREPLGSSIDPRHPGDAYPRLGGEAGIPVRIIGADTGENGFFAIGEFQAITYPRQMEFVTPEECARTVVLEILGASTGRDVIAAIDGAITEPSYRAGVLRDRAIREMNELEAALEKTDEWLPSIAIGHLGPPRLSKLLIEAWLLSAALESRKIETLLAADAVEMQQKVESWLSSHPRVESLVATIGIGVLREGNGNPVLTRGPRLNIPVPAADGQPIPMDDAAVERYANVGWVDLRLSNFNRWRERLMRITAVRPDIAADGSASFGLGSYMPRDFIPGDVVGWLLTTETDEMGIPGHRIL